jgi:hypothetical protein
LERLVKKPQRSEAGYTLLETIIGCALGIGLVAMAGIVWAKSEAVAARARPEAVRVGVQAGAFEELRDAVRLAGARLAYFDLIKTVKGRLRAAPTSGPPSGWCLAVASDPSTWPPGFDPRDSSTWMAGAWWSGAVVSDPSTWYWDCTARTARVVPQAGTPIPHQFTLAPAFSYGDGVRLGPSGLHVVGPVTVVDTAIAPGQEGQALALLRVATGAHARLGATLESATGVVTLCATTSGRADVIANLQAGDLLVVTGRSPVGDVRTALVQLTGPATQVAKPTPGGVDGSDLATYYEVRCDPVDAVYGFGLRNADRTVRDAPSICADAAVAVLERDEPVVVYYTARDQASGRLRLLRCVGDPSRPVALDILVEDAAAPLRIESELVPVGSADAYDGPAERLREVRIWAPVAERAATTVRAEVVEMRLELPHGAALRRPVELVWDAMPVAPASPPSGPGLPSPGVPRSPEEGN